MRYIKPYSTFINESRSKLDSLSGKIVKKIFRQWVNDWNSGSRSSSYFDQIEDILEFDIYADVSYKGRGFVATDATGADGRDTDDEGDWQTPHIRIDFTIQKSWLPGYWQELYMHLSDVVRHEIEHITQDGKDIGNYKKGKPDEDDSELRQYIKMGLLPEETYLMLPKEVDANLQGLRYESKKRKESMKDSVERYLNSRGLNDEQQKTVLDKWRRRAKEIGGIPKF
jgi:hypothetical protein